MGAPWYCSFIASSYRPGMRAKGFTAMRMVPVYVCAEEEECACQSEAPAVQLCELLKCRKMWGCDWEWQ